MSKYTTIDVIGYDNWPNIKKYYVVNDKIEKFPEEINEEILHRLPYSCYYKIVNGNEYRFINTFPNLCGFVLKDIMFDTNSKRAYLVIRIQHGELVYDEESKKYFHKLNLPRNAKSRYDLIDINMNNEEIKLIEYISNDEWWKQCIVMSTMKLDEVKKLYDEYNPRHK